MKQLDQILLLNLQRRRYGNKRIEFNKRRRKYCVRHRVWFFFWRTVQEFDSFMEATKKAQ